MATATTRISLIWSRKYPFFCIYKIFTLGLALDLRLHRCDYQKSTYSMFKHFSFVLFVLSTSVPCEMAFCFQVRSLESWFKCFPFLCRVSVQGRCVTSLSLKNSGVGAIFRLQSWRTKDATIGCDNLIARWWTRRGRKKMMMRETKAKNSVMKMAEISAWLRWSWWSGEGEYGLTGKYFHWRRNNWIVYFFNYQGSAGFGVKILQSSVQSQVWGTGDIYRYHLPLCENWEVWSKPLGFQQVGVAPWSWRRDGFNCCGR